MATDYGALGAAGIAGAFSIAGGKISGKDARKMQARQWGHAKEAAQHHWRWETKSLREAGLNPMLTFATGGQAPTPQAPGRPSGHLGEGIARAGRVGAEAIRLAIERKLGEATAKKTDEEAKAIEIDNLTRVQRNMLAVQQARHATELLGIDVASARQFLQDPEGPLSIKDTLTKSQASAAQARASADEAMAALREAGLPIAEFEGKGGRYLVDAARALITAIGRKRTVNIFRTFSTKR